MSTLLEEIASLERRTREMREGIRPKDTRLYGAYIGRLEGLRQRQMNAENMQFEIAKCLDGWQDWPSTAYGDVK